ncbi:TetR/AcrR family transcriptional regulator [Granulicella arctica]|uniref:TetR/AcrR family transcriptional regulator n=1 Tax=Granulicella arctica TaxID=940613 RepID=UPI0021E0C8A6|nr:TetR/AcrR family transcriptional regulator [Granulicella arctica]
MVSIPPDRRTRKRLATRQNISDIASRLFVERGFDHVTVDEIAEAADVARMTVFNHFPRKEDMFFDLDEEGREDLLAALQRRDAGTSPIEALRLFAHWAIAEQRPYVRFFEGGSERFIETIRASEALKARARAIRDELTDTLTIALTKAAKRRQPDPAATLAATLLVATWEVAFLEAHRIFHQSRNIKKANAVFLAIVDQGTRGLKAAVVGSPYP